MKLKGKIQRLLPMQQGTSKNGNPWQKVEFIVEESGETYPDILCITAFNDKVGELTGINPGDEVEVEFNCRVNEYNGRVYNSLSMYKIEKSSAQQAPAPLPQQQPFEQQQGNTPLPIPGDDLPF